MSERKHVLAARMDATIWEALGPALSRAEFELNQVPSIEGAGELARMIPFDVILVGCAEDDSAVAPFLAAFREPDSRSRAAKVLLFSPPALLAVAESHLGRGADLVLSTALDPLVLQETILGLLRSRPRVALRVMARLTVRLGEGTSRFICQTRDLSRSGMLAITGSRYPLGTSVSFALDLPDHVGSVQGEAEVARHAVRGRDADDGLGLRFVTFVAEGERRLGAFLAKHSA